MFHQLQAEKLRHITRRRFLHDCPAGIGGLWMAAQGVSPAAGKLKISRDPSAPLAPLLPGFAPKAKTRYDEGLHIPCMRIGENFELRRDILDFMEFRIAIEVEADFLVE